MNFQDQHVGQGSTTKILPTHVYVCLTGDREFQHLQKTDVTLHIITNLKPKLWVPSDCLYEIRATKRRTIQSSLLCLTKSYIVFWESYCAWQRTTLYSGKANTLKITHTDVMLGYSGTISFLKLWCERTCIVHTSIYRECY